MKPLPILVCDGSRSWALYADERLNRNIIWHWLAGLRRPRRP